jgi:hypothetical protein
MSEKELIAAGYRTYPPNHGMGDTWNIAYQKRFRREDGRTRYFLDVKIWLHSEDLIGYEVFLNVNRGCEFFPTEAHLRVMIGHIHD